MERLKRRTDFQAAARGARAPGKAFVLQVRSRGDEGGVRVGFTVSRQVGNAVVRNRVRRRLREMVRLSGGGEAGAKLCAGHDYVLIGRRAALLLPFVDLMRDFNAAVRRVHAKAATLEETGAHRDRSPHRSGLVTGRGTGMASDQTNHTSKREP